MHIEPGVVTGAKIVLSYATAAGAGVYGLKLAWDAARESGLASVVVRAVLATVATFVFFEVFPHYAVGVSEVHLILGSTLFLLFGAGPAAMGLAAGLLLQGLFFAPSDLPQYGMNVTTLLVPLFAVAALAHRIIAPGTAYVDLKYSQVLALSAAFQGGVVAWVGFWALYGEGVDAVDGILSFGAAYLLVIALEPLVDLAVLAGAKAARGLRGSAIVTPRLFA
ncbi:energy-coupling factor ABC transporter permease [Paracoccus sp. (in: a-proteobacteria)]|uniref:energy-coupling factor ABC transporter permease n=1 Tax=Paracoccus sp. TaxID=267 RepID=UPI0026E0FF64|nr:energy-coupling factor ABC transporter permease [Paracoccus sp. (in: a-proteobacteria)]MDO5648574.1 energy-coupling factor ABC transporter permease [Paracoccus sp. (in: a-proteobacteria)]